MLMFPMHLFNDLSDLISKNLIREAQRAADSEEYEMALKYLIWVTAWCPISRLRKEAQEEKKRLCERDMVDLRGQR